MNTLIAEQAREIAILKALGGRRQQIGGITTRTAAMLGQVAVAAGLAMSFLALGQSIDSAIAQAVGKLHFTIGVGEAAGSGARPFGSQALAVAVTAPGVSGAQPVEESSVQYNGQAYAAWGLGPRPLYSYRLSAGRWFTGADAGAVTPPVVLGPVAAEASGARVGQDITLDMAAGPVRVRVIGIDTGRNNSGDIVYFPLPTLERLDGTPAAANSLWVSTASSAHAAIDRAATAVASRLAAAGYPVTTTKIYALEAQYDASENSILAIVEILGLVVVAIMLMGLASALSMGIIERTREIGILRCLGARARHIRRIFTTEAVVQTLAGWAAGILLGWLVYQGLLSLVRHEADLILPQDFQPIIPLIALAGVLALTLIVIRGPLHRAKRIQPGTALRYQ
jgi:putative ABC transport system permease protein